jgi:hypothetical protein
MPFRRVLFLLATIVVPDFWIPIREEKNTNNAQKNGSERRTFKHTELIKA